MPVTPTYPGVYVEEVSSGVRTITGVATSITAFLGRSPWGPVDEPATINNFGEFERLFGGLHVDYPLGFAVRDFYQNGGSQAIITRLFKSGITDGFASGDLGTTNALKIEAASPGVWGNALYVSFDIEGITPEVASRYGLSENDLFNLTVLYLKDKADPDGEFYARERIINLSVVEGARRVDRVLEEESSLIRFPESATLPSSRPEDATPTFTVTLTNGVDSAPLVDVADFQGSESEKTGMYALEKVDLFNLLCIPPDTMDGDVPTGLWVLAMEYCADRRSMLIVDPPGLWGVKPETAATAVKDGLSGLGLSGISARNAALYFPRVKQSNSLREDQIETFVPCGLVAGVMARTDVQRGIWKAPAGIDASLSGITGLEVNLTDAENGILNPLGVNCLRSFPVYGRVVWGARTMRGADQLADEYKYIPVRRLALYLEESLYRGTKWVVFEPNADPLWAQIRLNIGAFMHRLFRQGAFQGITPKEAYFVKCDKETTTQDDINLGIVNIVVGFAPLKPAEFVIIKLQQMAGEIET